MSRFFFFFLGMGGAVIPGAVCPGANFLQTPKHNGLLKFYMNTCISQSYCRLGSRPFLLS